MRPAVPGAFRVTSDAYAAKSILLCPFDPMIAGQAWGNSRGNQGVPVHAAVATVFDWRCSQFRELSGLIYRIRMHCVA